MNIKFTYFNQKFLKPTFIYMGAEGPSDDIRVAVEDTHKRIDDKWRKDEKMGGASATDKDKKGVVPEGSVSMDRLIKVQDTQKDLADLHFKRISELKAKVDKSPVAVQYKKDLLAKISSFEEDHSSNIQNISVKPGSERALSELAAKLGVVEKGIENLEKNDSLRILLGLGERRDKVSQMINIKTLNIDSDHLRAFSDNLMVKPLGVLPGSNGINDLQNALNVPKTGVIDIPTLKAIGEVIGVSVDPQPGSVTLFADGSVYESPKEIQKADEIKIVQAKIDALNVEVKKGSYSRFKNDGTFRALIRVTMKKLENEIESINGEQVGDMNLRSNDPEPKDWASNKVENLILNSRLRS